LNRLNISRFFFLIFISSGCFAATTCDDLDGAFVLSQESPPEYLGFFGSSFQDDSIANSFGDYGGSFEDLSVNNSLGFYGSSIDPFSAGNPNTNTPPAIFKFSTIIGFLTTNTSIEGGVSAEQIDDASCSFSSFSPNLAPLTICGDLDGAYLLSQDSTPEYLGFFGSRFATDSINESFGKHGGQFETLSVRNANGDYGSSFGSLSAQNPRALSPPGIFRFEELIGFLSTNPSVVGGISLATIDRVCSPVSGSALTGPSQPPASGELDTDGDGINDDVDTDDDNDGVADVNDAFDLDASESIDTDADGVGNNADTDDDGDGTADANDLFPLDSSLATCAGTSSGSVKLGQGQFIELPVRGTCLTSPSGTSLGVPSTATAASLNVTVVTPGAAGFITVYPCGVARPNASNLNFVAGDVVPNGVVAPIGSNGSVCLYSSQTTDLIVDVAGWFEGDAFVGATPQRLVDTRDGTGGQLGQLVNDAPLVVQATGIAATTAAGGVTTIPTTAGTVALNVTVVSPDSPGFITVYPCDAPRPLASNLNYIAGQVVANGVIAPVSSTGQVCLYSQSPTDIIVDLAGWFPGNAFTGATPQRLVDTRDGTGVPVAKLSPASQLDVAVQGASLTVSGSSSQVPANATAAAMNVTVVNPEAAGFVTVWPCSAERPNASNLNFTAGKVVANNVVAPIGDQGNVCFFASQNTDIIVDISGYFTGESGNQFVGSTPKRFVDTRDGTGPAPQ